MKTGTNSCPCCGSSVLRHARQGGVYWFCPSCWQEVPVLTVSQMHHPKVIVPSPLIAVKR